MPFYSRRQIIEILEVDDAFIASLEAEEVLIPDHDADPALCFSERMLERARAAHTVVHELDVNVAGAAVIVRMREEMMELRRLLERTALELSRARGQRD